jgi:thiol-disulfide isomerase/thioredoxin
MTSILRNIPVIACAAIIGVACKDTNGLQGMSYASGLSLFDRQVPSLQGATGWVNSAPLDASSLRGKVVVFDFWTYTCINWMRTAPYVRTWAEKYKQHGLMVIGVHSPEFAFEREPDRVRKFTKDMDLVYPIAIDSEHAIWRAFHNQYWPALYIADGKGRIRYEKFGEGDYDKAEAMIVQLLRENGAVIDTPASAPVGQGPEAPADWLNLKTPETYIGYARSERFDSRGNLLPSVRHDYAAPRQLRNNEWGLSGPWTVASEYARSDASNARVMFRFHARDVHLVMGPTAPDRPVRIRVLVDGKAPGESHGSDIDADGMGVVWEHRMYQLIRQTRAIEFRDVEVQFFDRGVEIYAFTFG